MYVTDVTEVTAVTGLKYREAHQLLRRLGRVVIEDEHGIVGPVGAHRHHVILRAPGELQQLACKRIQEASVTCRHCNGSHGCNGLQGDPGGVRYMPPL